jgi:alpha-L-fucosidase 2
LLQSHFLTNETSDGTGEAREIWLLPALPPSWEQGSVKGLVARGGFVIDVAWSEGRVNRVEIESRLGGEVVVRYDVQGRGGGTVTLGGGDEGGEVVETVEGGRFRVRTEQGQKYVFGVTWEDS